MTYVSNNFDMFAINFSKEKGINKKKKLTRIFMAKSDNSRSVDDSDLGSAHGHSKAIPTFPAIANLFVNNNRSKKLTSYFPKYWKTYLTNFIYK